MYVMDLEKIIIDGNWEGNIGRVNRSSIQIWTEKRFQGIQIKRFYTSGSLEDTKLRIQGYSGTVYISYEKIEKLTTPAEKLRPGLISYVEDNHFIEDYVLEAILDRVNELELKEGVQGEKGDSIEFVWDGSKLGVKKEGEETYSYVDLGGNIEDHKLEILPHTFVDKRDNKTYKYGIQIGETGHLQIIYEEYIQ